MAALNSVVGDGRHALVSVVDASVLDHVCVSIQEHLGVLVIEVVGIFVLA